MPRVLIPLKAFNSAVPDLAREILTDRLTARLRLGGVYPVVFTPGKGWLGMCARLTDVPDGELYLAPKAASYAGLLLDIYCHELAHRLVRATDAALVGHDWSFAAMQAILLRRASGHISGQPRIQSIRCYDVCDEPEERWGWAIQRALGVSAALADLKLSAEECAEKIWEIWYAERYQPREQLPRPDWSVLR